MRVNVVCRNLDDDRVIPRFARYLRDRLGWTLTRSPDPAADAVYLSGYFEAQMCPTWPAVPVGALFTHREEEPPGNGKAKLYDAIARRVQLRVAMCRLYAEPLSRLGPTIQAPLPVERERFTPSPRPSPRGRGGLVCGFSGYTYSNRRKGEDLVRQVLASKPAQGVDWRASGRGWPVATRRYAWRDMPAFYQSLDVLVCTSRVEGGPMPPLEALACGVSVVVPAGVGIIDELPDVPGIYRYKRGDAGELVRALCKAVAGRGIVDREALRAVTAGMTVEAWCRAHEEVFVEMMDNPLSGMEEEPADLAPMAVEDAPDVDGDGNPPEGNQRGIYVVAFGGPARRCARRLMKSAKQHMPGVPICLCAAEPIGPEDVLVVQPDSDVGGRRAKLLAYELTPPDWTSALYLDADTVVTADISFYFDLVEAGWEFVVCTDPHDTMHFMRHRMDAAEMNATTDRLGTLHTLQYNGGAWSFRRNERVRRFFRRWLAEWERYAQRDQGALVRAMYAAPLKVYLLGNEWNTFERYNAGLQTAGLMHYPTQARRWKGVIRGRIDGPNAWTAVRQFEGRRR